MAEDDRRPLCLMVLSCIAVGPRIFLPLSDDFHKRYRLQVIENHQANTLPEQIAGLEEQIQGCDVFIYHSADWIPGLGDKHGMYEDLIAKIPAGIRKISFPLPHLYAFWPFHTNDPRNLDPNRPVNRQGVQPFYPYGDSYVLELLRQSLPPEEAISRYVNLDVATVVDLDKLMSSTLSSAARHDQTTDIKVADFIEHNFRSHKLFQTVNHANNRLLLNMSNQLLDLLDCERASERVLDRMQELTLELTMPIHPSIGRYFGAPYAAETTRYPVDRIRYLTFAEYVRDYVYFV